VTGEELNRWTVFLQWAHKHKFMANLYRPKSPTTMYYDYRIQLRLNKEYLVLVARHHTLDGAISEIKKKIMVILPVK
jgi:hypothetical protein